MPNYIKNRITLLGSEKQIKNLIEKFSTFHKEVQNKSFDNDLTFENNGVYGWFNEKTNTFSRRNEPDVLGIPEGFEPSMQSSFTQFPDFEKVIPMPESLHISSGSWIAPLENHFMSETKFKEHIDKVKAYCESNPMQKDETIKNLMIGIKNYIEYGHASWYSWSVEHWGTKWNSSECKSLGGNVFEFITAWSATPMIISKISSEFKDVKILYEYSDEDTGYNCGFGVYENGFGEIEQLKDGSVEAYELAFKLRPEYKENYVLIDGNYEYKEED